MTRSIGIILAALFAIWSSEGHAYTPCSTNAIGNCKAGQGLAVASGAAITNVADRTVTSSASILSTDMGGVVNFNGSSLTATIPAISSTVLAAGMSVTITNYNSSALTISSTPTINGCSISASLPQYGWLSLVSNGTSLDATCGVGTSTASGITVTDGTNTVNGSTTITFSGATVSGSTPSPTVTVTGGGGSSVPATPQGRLTLTSGVPVLTTDTTSTTIYYDNYAGNKLPYYTGSADAGDTITGGEVSTAMAASGTGVINSAGVFDVWWGSYTQIDDTTWSSCGYYNPVILQRSALSAQPNGTPFTVLMGGDFNQPSTCYKFWAATMTANTH